MGCQASKPTNVGVPEARPTSTAPQHLPPQPSLTLLEKSIDLPTVDVHVVKEENAGRQVMAAAEKGTSREMLPPREEAEATQRVLDQLAEVAELSRSAVEECG